MEYLIIDPSTRKIAVPKSEQLFGVYGEGNIERKYFKCPKIVGDNVDLHLTSLDLLNLNARLKIL